MSETSEPGAARREPQGNEFDGVLSGAAAAVPILIALLMVVDGVLDGVALNVARAVLIVCLIASATVTSAAIGRHLRERQG